MCRPEEIFVFSAIKMHVPTVFNNKYYSKVELQLTLAVQKYLLKNDFLQSSLKSPLCPLQVSGPSLKTSYTPPFNFATYLYINIVIFSVFVLICIVIFSVFV